MDNSIIETTNFDYDTDVLIVGFGAAGANAAIAAHDDGARVMILEKMDIAGGNSRCCAGTMVLPNTVEEGVAYYRALSFGLVSEEMVRAFAEAMVNIPQQLTDMGIELEFLDREPAYFANLVDGNLRRIQVDPVGKGGVEFLENQVQQRNIDVLMETQALELIQDNQTGSVMGLKALKDGKEIKVLARKGVILACGGYASNPEMLANFHFPGATDYIFSWGNPGNTGDGLKMASAAGAALWHMAPLEWGLFCARKPSREFGTVTGAGIGFASPGHNYIFVNRYGERFMSETTKMIHRKGPLEILKFDHESAEYCNLPAYMIFDESLFCAGPLATTQDGFKKVMGGPVGYAATRPIYEWSEDNQAELEKGWIYKGASIKELAQQIGVNEDALSETIRNYNTASENKQDPEFNRAETSLVPIESPPYYAIEIALSLVNTQGGPKHDIECQVMDHNDRPIPGLYAAGELGSFFGSLYQGGTNYPEAWAFGRIAGKKVAAVQDRVTTA